MSDYKMFNFTPQVVNNKGRYREEEEKRNKMTYNFTTDPRLKRGRNFGVVYVTSPQTEEKEESRVNKKSEVNAKIIEAEEKHEIYKKIENFDGKRSNLGVNTDPVTSTVRPKPLTFEIETQTGEYLDTPQIPLFWPVQTGFEVGTQIEDGDLFDFDQEVEPILNVLMSKILEQSRMEVLEEEEIRKMKEHQREFERLRNRELEEVQTLEKKEMRINEEKERRIKEQKHKKINAIVHQKKLFCRTFAKEYLQKLKQNSFKHLIQRGIFKNPLEDVYQSRLMPQLHQQSEQINSQDYVVVNKLSGTFKNNFILQKQKLHRDALNKEKERKEELERKRLEEIARKEEEKRRKQEEEIRRKREIEIQALKASINEELIKHAEYVEDPVTIYDINSYYQKDIKYSPVLGGYYSQFAILIAYLNKLQGDYMNEEKLLKVLELFLPKLPHFYIIYTSENLQEIKGIAPLLNEIEEIPKLDENTYTNIIEKISNDMLINDDILSKIFDTFLKLGYDEVMNAYHILIACLMRLLKSTEFNERIKFLLKDTTIDNNFTAVCELFTESVHKMKIPEFTSSLPTAAAGKKSIYKKPNVVQAKLTFDPEFYEKTVILPTFNEKMKILAINHNFERMIRHNIFECMNKISKLDGDKETIKQEFEEFYSNEFLDNFISDLAQGMNKERLEFNISPPVANLIANDNQQ